MGNAISRLFSSSSDKGKGGDKALSEKLKDLKTRLDGMKEKVGRALHSSTRLEKEADRMSGEMESLKVLCGRIASASLAGKPAGTPFSEVEFQVFSQWGEDGILQHLLHHVPVVKKEFVEFGVESYAEASTRFLLIKDNWRGLILDGSAEHMNHVKNSTLYWRQDLTAKCAFITPDNINELLQGAGFTGEIGIFSVDVDGMDYWIWKAVNVVSPTIVISEYNSIFGPHAAVTIPPDNAFQRGKAHSSNIFYGVSLSALESLADEKGYDLVGVNSAGNNAFFVKRGVQSPFPARKAADIFVEAKFREARDAEGKLTFAPQAERQQVIASCDVFDVRAQKVRKLEAVWAETGR